MGKCRYAAIVVSLVVVLGGCASSEEWSTWKDHPSHFSSGDHMFFSLRNREGTGPRVTRQDVAAARSQGWWGKSVTVGQEQIIER